MAHRVDPGPAAEAPRHAVNPEAASPRLTRRRALRLALPFVAVAGLADMAGAADNSACLGCHEETSAGKHLPASVHAKAACVDCHATLKGVELPHEVPVAKAECGGCHEPQRAQFDLSLHGKALARGDELAPRCQNCHGAHDITRSRAEGSAVAPIRVPFVCGSCHREGGPVTKQRNIHQAHILENYSESIHGDGLLKKGLAVSANCASCHGAHLILPHTDERSSIARKNIPATCMKCHSMIRDVHRKIISGKAWEGPAHALPVCADCHQPHKARKVFYEQGVSDRDCLTCHGKTALKAADGRPLAVRHALLKGSIHAKTGCSQCHAGVSPAHQRPCDTVAKRVDCASCHSDAVTQYRASIHGKLSIGGDDNAPDCADCHGTHNILSRKTAGSPTFPTSVPGLCARCHREGQKAALRYKGREHSIPEHYTESIHGKGLLKSGLLVTATCVQCHGGHKVLPAADPASSVNRKNVAATCAQCHNGVYEAYADSVHGPAYAGKRADGAEAPGCSDCHSAHTIKRTDLEGFRMEVMGRCGKCHRETAMSYFDTYHGKVSKLGYGKTAKCHDCHGAHDILPPTDARSHLSRGRVVETCRKCHPGATRRFAGYFTHATHHEPGKYPLLFWSFWGMTSLLVGTFAMGGLHTILWLPRLWAIRRRQRTVREGDSPLPAEGARQVQRFTGAQRLTHVLLIISFITLALTGMTLKFSYTPWAAALSRGLGGYEAAGWLHRIAAVLMFGLFITHVRDLLRRAKAAGGWKSFLTGPDTLMLTMTDYREFIGTFRWFLGKGERPRYGRWTYWEKFDYFAVFWGVAIIGSTGLMLWFPEWFTRVLPGWLINVATIIHSDEALLAVGFIFTVHFFNTHFRPDKFPMDLVMFTGRAPLEEWEHDRPSEAEVVRASGDLERRLVPPPSPELVRAARIFGTIALVIGLALVVAIISAMLFAYR